MKKFALLASLAVAAGTVGCGANPVSQTRALGGQVNLAAAAVPGQVLVKLKPGVNAMGVMAARSAFGLRMMSAQSATLNRMGWTMMSFDAARTNVASVLGALATDPGVAYAEPNYVATVSDFSPVRPGVGAMGRNGYNDPMAGDQYTLDKVETAAAHAVTQGSERTLLAIVDTGVDYNHPDFMSREGRGSRVVKGKDFANMDDDPMDVHGHGTHCAGIAAATSNNGEGIVGQAPGVRILAVKVLGDNGSGSYGGVANGIIYSADQGASVISMSLGGPSNSKVVEDAVKYAMAKGSLVMAAMGNDGRKLKSFPAGIPGVMAVGSTNVSEKRSSYSNFGEWISVGAPGEGIISTLPMKGSQMGKVYGKASGTSMATPCAAGVAALVRDQHPEWDAAMVRAHLERTSDDLGSKGFDVQFGHGRINARRAVTE
ncbi:MAG: S8 family peptidase [Candidatus Sericytochromatia bacterium]|nr:S8 family peptidase [Candidatus Sericytochromatia bacterium]